MPKGIKVIPYLRTENLKKHTLSRGTYLYSPYMGDPPGNGETSLKSRVVTFFQVGGESEKVAGGQNVFFTFQFLTHSR